MSDLLSDLVADRDYFKAYRASVGNAFYRGLITEILADVIDAMNDSLPGDALSCDKFEDIPRLIKGPPALT